MKKIKISDIINNKIKKEHFVCLNMEKNNWTFFLDTFWNELNIKYWYYDTFQEFEENNKRYLWKSFGYIYNLIYKKFEESKLDIGFINILWVLKEREGIVMKKLTIYYLEIYDLKWNNICKCWVPKEVGNKISNLYEDLINNKIDFDTFSLSWKI